MIRKSSNHWKFLAVLFPIIGTCAFGQPQPGGLGGFFSAWYGASGGDPYERLLPTAYWYPSEDLNNTDRILGIASTNTVNAAAVSANGWEFNGSSQYMDMGRPPEIEIGTNSQYSMAVWVQRRGALSGSLNVGGIMGKSALAGADRWVIYGVGANLSALISEGTVNFVGLSDGVTNATNVWFHLAMTIDMATSTNNNFFLYKDGVRVATKSFFTTNAITYAGNVNAPFRFGSYNTDAGAPANYWNGYIDRAAVWNGRVLTSNEVFNLFQETRAGRK